jgi:Cft2 family RNA processing exonuclease
LIAGVLAHDARKHGREPLYNEHDIANAMKLWEGVGYHQKVEFARRMLDAVS